MSDEMSLEELGVTDDPGTSWHPRQDKTEARNADGNLRDLSSEEVAEHGVKPEANFQYDSTLLLAAEDSEETPEGVV